MKIGSGEQITTKSLPERRAERLSEIFPVHILAYSCVLKSPGGRIGLEELLQEILSFPDVPDARDIYLIRDEGDLFGLGDVDNFDVPLGHFVKFEMEDLKQVLNSPPFLMQKDEVVLTQAVEYNMVKTLNVLRHIFPDDSELELNQKINRGLIAYFHKQKINTTGLCYPPLLSSEVFLKFQRTPTREEALLCLFCAKRTNVIPLSQYTFWQYSEFITIGEQRVPIGEIIGDIIPVVLNSHFLRINEESMKNQ